MSAGPKRKNNKECRPFLPTLLKGAVEGYCFVAAAAMVAGGIGSLA